MIGNDYWRSAGRAGVGTVMRSKHFKGIMFQGNRQRSLYYPDRLKALFFKIAREAQENPAVNAYKSMGNPMSEGTKLMFALATNQAKLKILIPYRQF